MWQGSQELAKAITNWGHVSTYLPQHDYGGVAEAFKPRWVRVESGENYRDGQRIPDQPCLEYEVAAWETDGNAAKATVNWRFTTADARIKLKRRLPIN